MVHLRYLVKMLLGFITNMILGAWYLIRIPLLVVFGVIYVGTSDRTDDFAIVCKMIFCGSIFLIMLYTVMHTLMITS